MRAVHPKFIDSFDSLTSIPTDWYDTLWVYMCHGLLPGGMLTRMLTGDFEAAIKSCHPNLPVQSLKELLVWLDYSAPAKSYGSEQNLKYWVGLSDTERRDIMIECELRPGEFEILRGDAVA